MPMDIRSFFQPKKKQSKKGDNSDSAAAAAASSSSSTKRKQKKNEKEEINVEEKKRPSSSSRTKKPIKKETKQRTKKKIVDDDDLDETSLNRQQSVITLDESDDDDFSKKSPSKRTNKKSSSSPAMGKKRKKPPQIYDDDDDDDDPIEISPTEYFSKRASSPSKKKYQKTKPIINEEASEDEDYDKVKGRNKRSKEKATRSSSKSKKGSSSRKRSRNDDDDSDTDFEANMNQKDDNFDDDDDDDDNDEDFVMKKAVDDHDDDDDEFFEEEAKPKARKTRSPRVTTKRQTSPVKKSPPPKKPRKSPTSSKQQKTKITSLEPTLELDHFDVDTCEVPECLQGLTFVFTGNMDNISKEESMDLVKTLGGRVTGSVSSKTTYLVAGETLEDGRHYTEGSKYKAATEKHTSVIVVQGEKRFYGLCQLYQEKAKREKGADVATSNSPDSKEATVASSKSTPLDAKPAPSAISNPYAKKLANPYAKKASVNPYAKKAQSNPSAKPAPSNPYAKKASASSGTGSQSNTINDVSQLWVDKHAPQNTREILGNQENIKKLKNWLAGWERTFNNPKSYDKSFSNPKGPWKAALLSGPPGIGKTTTATLVAKEAERDLLEFNASDARSKKALQNNLGDVTGSQTLNFQTGKSSKKKQPAKLRCIIMDEVDGMGAGDRSGMAELIQMIKKSKVPIICICNDRQSQKMKSLLPYCMDLRFKRPVKSVLANRAVRLAKMEGMEVERNAAEAIAESCGNDVRQVLNCLQMWANKQGSDGALTYRGLKEREKSINKDEILRVSLFDAAKTVMEGRKNLSGANAKSQVDSLFKRNDAFFVDYSLVGLLVHENYPKVMINQLNAINRLDDEEEKQGKTLDFLEQMHDATQSMSDYAMVEHEIRSGDLNWSLLPASGMLTVKTGYHAGGESGGFLPGFPAFTSWMGKNSSKGKKYRLLNEMHYHMNFKVGGGTTELRQSYMPILRDRFLTLLKSEDDGGMEKAIELMDDYGLSREDVMEKFDELVIGTNNSTFADIATKQKAAFTREYNKGSHMSQALVSEQGGGSKTTKKSFKKEKDPGDLDAIDEDVVNDDESDVDEAEDLKKLQEKFKRKGRKGRKSSKKSSKK